MNKFGVEVKINHVPPLDREFAPLFRFNQEFLKTAEKPVCVAVERSNGQIAVKHTYIHATTQMYEADCYYIERLVKTLLWVKGGCRILIAGDEGIYRHIRQAYSPHGSRAFDYDYFSSVYGCQFEVRYVDDVPEEHEITRKLGGHLEGCRIGFDAGGSDRKVSAVIDGRTAYSEEVVWAPKLNADPGYHYAEIVEAMKTAATHLPRVDAVGVSTAGVVIDDRVRNSSLFLQVPKVLFDSRVSDIYGRAIRDTFGDVPYCIVNDGDVAALAGSMSLGKNNVLGIAMGTSEAGGYVNADGDITGWINELAFVPIDANPAAMCDEWSQDIGCGVKYFSQDGVIKLAQQAGIGFPEGLSPAEKLKQIQWQMERGEPEAVKIYESIGVYLGHTLAYYYSLYTCQFVLLLGRVMSGKGGDIILQTAKRVLTDEYPNIAARISVVLPDEKFRRIGQSLAAASLPVAFTT